MFDWVTDFIRNLFFSIAQLGGFIADSIYTVVKAIVVLDAGQYSGLWTWYAVMITFVGFFTTIRVSSAWIKASFNEEYRDTKYKPINAIIGVILITLTLAIFPLGAKYVTSVSQYAIENVGVFVGDSSISELNPTTIITSNLVTGLQEKIDGKEIAQDKKITMTINELSSKLNEKNNKKYKYLPEFWHIFFVGGVILLFGIGMILFAFQFVKRMYAIIVKIVIAPIPISSLVTNDSDSFNVWIKMIVADALTNFIQYLMLYITLLTATSNFIVTKAFFLSAVVLLGGLLFLLEGIPQLAQLIGGDISAGGALQQLSTIRMATGGLSRGVSNIASFGAGAAVTAGAFGIYSAGRSMGGKSLLKTGINQLNAINNVGSNSSGNTNVKDYFQNNTSSENTNNNGVSKPNTIANTIANYGNKGSGKTATFARVASNVGSHLYQKSANRLANNKIAGGLHHTNNARRTLQNSFKKPTQPVVNPQANTKQNVPFAAHSDPDITKKRGKF